MSHPQVPTLLNHLSKWISHQHLQQGPALTQTLHTVPSLLLCSAAASISSAGGVGGGSLYLPILNLVAGIDLKTATSYSALMVTAGSASNVLYNLVFGGGSQQIDYEIALLSEPCMLLGVSVGVICNIVFPEWLITALFVLFLACSTISTCMAGCKRWRSETCGGGGEEDGADVEETLLVRGEDAEIPGLTWRKVLVLVMVWFCFFVLHLVLGDKDGKWMIHIRPCGHGYWLITLCQIPLAFSFSAYIIYENWRSQHQKPHLQTDGKDIIAFPKMKVLPIFVFPVVALLSGILGGLFGIGGGLLINPVLLRIGIPPQITAATTTFMVLFSASMSSIQYLILGVNNITQAFAFTAVCFVASVFGLVIIQGAIKKSGRTSLIVFSVSVVMALSMLSIACFGSVEVWRDYTSGKNMGFNLLC